VRRVQLALGRREPPVRRDVPDHQVSTGTEAVQEPWAEAGDPVAAFGVRRDGPLEEVVGHPVVSVDLGVDDAVDPEVLT
jgi:hypothetical protein